MTAIHKRVRAGFAACALLLTSHQTGVAQAAHPCAVKEKLTLALARAQQHQREPHEFDGVAMVAGSFARTPIVDDVVEYAFLLKVGAGDHDVIRLHRVVREKAPCKPRSAHKALFLLHGAPVDFRTSFLPSLLSNRVPREQAFAVFLAQRNLDVWGLDLRWALVPSATTDFTFMQDWNYATDIHDIALSLALARGVRTLTGSGAGKLHLLGWSNGGMLAYAYANAETRFPRGRRHVKGLIPVDVFFKLSPSDEPLRQAACQRAAVLQSSLEAGTIANDNTLIQLLGSLAATAPDELSPIVPSLTNRTLALLVSAQTWAVGPPNFPPFVPFYHLLAGQFDPVSQLPTDLTYTRAAYDFDLLQAWAPWWVNREAFELAALPCNELDLPYDDHLGEITVPVLYVGAEGGFGRTGEYSTTLLGSTDVTTLSVSLLPQPSLDFGHQDLFWADNAQTVAWEPIVNWIRTH